MIGGYGLRGQGFGRGRGGRGRGFGFRGFVPPWPYVGLGRGGLPRCRYAGEVMGLGRRRHPYGRGTWGPTNYGWAPGPWAMPYASQMAPEADLGLLREQASVLKGQLDEIEARVKQLETEEP